MKSKFFSLRWKLLSGFVGLVLVSVLILLISASQIVESRIRSNIDTNFVEAGRVFERIQDIRFRQLRQTAVLLADLPKLRAAISTEDTATINQTIREELLHLLDFEPVIPDSLVPLRFYTDPDSAGLLLICNAEGKPMGQMSSEPLPKFSVADRPGVSRALQGEMPNQTYIWKQGDRYFNVITIPVWTRTGLEGTLSYGFPMRQLETRQLSRDMGLEVLYYVNNQLLTASFDELSASNRNALSKGIHSATFEILDKGEATSIEVTLDEETWMVYIAPMFNPENIPQGINGYYAVAKSLTKALVPLQNLQLLIFGIGLLSIAGAIVISIWLTRRITKPIDLLVEGVRRVEQQDFSREVPVTSSDEIGQLTRAFNELVDGLRERLLMLKFVSEATLDAIKKNIARIEPGGERNNITIFFSDIRGFTSWSEKRTPEEVIDILNNLLSFQAEVVQEFGGDVDKFVGDELVAVFQGEDKDQKAVNAAIRIQKKMKAMLGEKHDDMSIGIGINSGEVVMGAMGSENRMDYTVLGNTVNLGARLCSAAGQGQILITNSVFLNLERRIPTRELDKIKVKGIENPVQIYEVDWEIEDLYIKKDVV